MRGLLLPLVLTCCAAAQQAGPVASSGLKLPQVKYVFDNEKLSPQHQELAVSEDGTALYSSTGSMSDSSSDSAEAQSHSWGETPKRAKAGKSQSGDSQSGESQTAEAQAGEAGTGTTDAGEHAQYSREFKISPETTQKIFRLAKDANHFHGNFDFKKSKIAFTGKKTLSYVDEKSSESTSFNWSQNSAVEQLAELFSGICATLEAEPKLEHMRKFDKLGLYRELKELQAAAKDGRLREVQIIAPILRQVANDSSVMAPARRQAEELASRAGSSQ